MALFTGFVLQKSLLASVSAGVSLSVLLAASGAPAPQHGAAPGASPAPIPERLADCPHERRESAVHRELAISVTG